MGVGGKNRHEHVRNSSGQLVTWAFIKISLVPGTSFYGSRPIHLPVPEYAGLLTPVTAPKSKLTKYTAMRRLGIAYTLPDNLIPYLHVAMCS